MDLNVAFEVEGIDEGIVEAETLDLKDSVRLGYDIAGFSESILSDFIERNEVDLKGGIFLDQNCLSLKSPRSGLRTPRPQDRSDLAKL